MHVPGHLGQLEQEAVQHFRSCGPFSAFLSSPAPLSPFRKSPSKLAPQTSGVPRKDAQHHADFGPRRGPFSGPGRKSCHPLGGGVFAPSGRGGRAPGSSTRIERWVPDLWPSDPDLSAIPRFIGDPDPLGSPIYLGDPPMAKRCGAILVRSRLLGFSVDTARDKSGVKKCVALFSNLVTTAKTFLGRRNRVDARLHSEREKMDVLNCIPKLHKTVFAALPQTGPWGPKRALSDPKPF